MIRHGIHALAVLSLVVSTAGCAIPAEDEPASTPTSSSAISGQATADDVRVQASGAPGLTELTSVSPVGRLYLSDANGAVTECSGTLVEGAGGEPVVASAAHCAYNATTGARFTSAVFALGNSTASTMSDYPHWTVDKVVISNGYVNAARTQSMTSYDYLFATLTATTEELTPYDPLPIDFEASSAASSGITRMVGFPAGGVDEYQRTCTATRGVGVFTDTGERFYIMPGCSFSRGASGAPLINTSGAVIAVTSTLSGTDNYAPALGSVAKQAWEDVSS